MDNLNKKIKKTTNKNKITNNNVKVSSNLMIDNTLLYIDSKELSSDSKELSSDSKSINDSKELSSDSKELCSDSKSINDSKELSSDSKSINKYKELIDDYKKIVTDYKEIVTDYKEIVTNNNKLINDNKSNNEHKELIIDSKPINEHKELINNIEELLPEENAEPIVDYEILFALRVSLQDEYDDEYNIIIMLKKYLYNNGISVEDTNGLIQNFYKHYGIQFNSSLLFNIEEINPPQINLQSNLLNFFDQIVSETISELNNSELNNSELNNSELNNSELNNSELNNSELNNSELNNSELSDNENNNNENNDNENNDNNSDISELPELIDNNLPNLPNIFNNLHFIQNNTNIPYFNYLAPEYNNLPNLLNGNQNDFNYLSPQYIFNNILTNTVFNNFTTDDVVCTLNKETIDKLNKYILTENLITDCNICLAKLVKNEVVIELNCNHIYHSECIKEWFEKYNYKCPICKKEQGHPEYKNN
jgi:hypothetical protein